MCCYLGIALVSFLSYFSLREFIDRTGINFYEDLLFLMKMKEVSMRSSKMYIVFGESWIAKIVNATRINILILRESVRNLPRNEIKSYSCC